jgi:glycosyltransferase involved in cell wall biosynthesis
MPRGPRGGGAKWRVLLVNSCFHIGGAEQVAASLCRLLDRDSFEVYVSYLKWPGMIGEALQREGYPVHGLPGGSPESRGYFTSFFLRRLIRQLDIDLVHSNDIHAFVDSSICRRVTPGLRQVHTFHFGNYPHPNRRHHWMEQMAGLSPDALVAVSQVQRDALKRTYRFFGQRVKVIRNGVSDPRDAQTSDLRDTIRKDAGVVLGSISTLIEQKGLPYLLQAVKLLVDEGLNFRFVIVGNGPMREELEQQRRDLGLESHLEFLGWIPDAARKVLPEIDVFVQSSLWEAMSMVVLEAMGSGRPVVATRVGENPYMVREGETGYLVEPRDVTALADRLRTLIQDAERREAMGCEARADYERHYTAQRMCSDYEALYLKVLESR